MSARSAIRAGETEQLEALGIPASGRQMLRAFDSLFRHDDPAADEMQGSLARAEAERLTEVDAPSQNEIDAAISSVLINDALVPDEYLCVYAAEQGGPPTGERENAYLELRIALGHLLVMPTPANHEAVARAVVKCVRLAMFERALEQIHTERDR